MEDEIYRYCEFCGVPLNPYSRQIHICDDCMTKIRTLLLEYDIFQHIVKHYDTVFKLIEKYEDEHKNNN